jgi:hypothetical protein
MKALTLIQPWATLIATEEKQLETRGWRTRHRGMLAIHAGMKIDFEACRDPEIKAALERHGYTDPSTLPTGRVLCTCKLFDCVQMQRVDDAVTVPGYKLSRKEKAFGNYAEGRFAFILANVRPLKNPVPAKGKLNMWEWGG